MCLQLFPVLGERMRKTKELNPITTFIGANPILKGHSSSIILSGWMEILMEQFTVITGRLL